MNSRSNYTRLLRHFLAVGLLMSPLSLQFLQAQEKQRYEGPLKLGDYLGEAVYTYLVNQGDTILDGTFVLERSNLEALLENKDASFAFTGAFKMGYPHGPWTFQFGEFQSDNTTRVVDYQYTLNISGLQTAAEGELNMGKPQGLWDISKDRIQGSELEKALFKSQILFENGVPQQSFQVSDSSNTLVGRFLRDGLAHDNWELYSDGTTEAVEVWSFDEGVLQHIQLQIDNETRRERIFDEDLPDTKTINLEGNYLQIVKLWRDFRKSSATAEGKVADLLAQNADFYNRINGILSAIGTSSFRPEFKVKVPFFPLDTIENKQLDSITTMFENSYAVSQSLLKDTHLNILKLSDEETEYLYKVVSVISEEFLLPLGELVRYQREDIVEYVPRDQLIRQLWPTGKPSEVITVAIGDEGNRRTFKAPGSTTNQWEEHNLNSLQQLAEYATTSLDTIAAVLQAKSTLKRREQEVIQLEELLLAQVNQLNMLVDSVTQNIPVLHQRALQNITTTVGNYLKEYSAKEQLDQKVAFGERLKQCFKEMDTLAKRVTQLPERSSEIAGVYQDAVWNPFTTTIMNERVKKRITGTYTKVVVPYFLEQIATALDCENAKTYSSSLERLHLRMLALREEETRKLERKLKKTQDPIAVLRLLNLLDTENED